MYTLDVHPAQNNFVDVLFITLPVLRAFQTEKLGGGLQRVFFETTYSVDLILTFENFFFSFFFSSAKTNQNPKLHLIRTFYLKRPPRFAVFFLS